MATSLGELIYTLTLNDEGFTDQVETASAGMDSLSAQATDSAGAVDKLADSSVATGGALDDMAGQARVAGAATLDAGASADDASGGFDLLGGSMLKTFAPLIALFAGYEGIKSVLNDTRLNTDLWNSSQMQINNTLKNTHDAVGLTVTQLENMADANSKGLPINEAANLAAENTLLNYQTIGKQVYPQVAAQVDNVATAMANLSGRTIANSDDVAAAAKKLGVAMEDPATGVTRLKLAGVDFSASQIDAIKTMEKTNGVTAAQTLLLSDLADVVGGKAKTSTQTFAGQLEMVRKQLDAQLEPAIKNIEKEMMKFGLVVLDVVKWLDQHRKGVKDVIEVLLPLAAGILIVVEALKTWKAITELIDALALDDPWVLAIMALIALALEIVTHWNDVKQWFSDFWTWIKNVFGDIVSFVKSNWELLAGILILPLAPVLIVWKLFHDQIIGFIEDAVKVIEGVWNTIIGFFSSVITTIKNAIESGVSGFGNLLYDAGKAIIDGLKKGITDTADDVMNAVKDIGSKAVSALKGVLKIFSPSQVFSDLGANISVGLAQGITGAGDQAVNATSNLATNVIGAATGVAIPALNNSNNNSNSTTNQPVTYNFAGANFNFSSADAVDEFFSIANRNTALELQGGSPMAGASGVA